MHSRQTIKDKKHGTECEMPAYTYARQVTAENHEARNNKKHLTLKDLTLGRSDELKRLQGGGKIK
jgi:hypothetical protein